MINRRQFITAFSGYATALALSRALVGCKKKHAQQACLSLQDEPLLPANDIGLMLRPGYKARIVAHSRIAPISGNPYLWHDAPDGGACFETGDSGWIYVSNSEIIDGGGGVGALRFNREGDIVDAYALLTGTTKNCAGGSTPWQTWLSCEEYDRGMVWECDPYGLVAAVAYPSMGRFAHEAAAVDPYTNNIYLSEDKSDGRFYRFKPTQRRSNGVPDLRSGILEVASINEIDSRVTWQLVPDPEALVMPTRYQVVNSSPFNGGEGLTYFNHYIYLSTKGDNAVWAYDILNQSMTLLFNGQDRTVLNGVDNLTCNDCGDILVAEDGGNMQIVIINKKLEIFPFCQLIGHDKSELTGISYSPDGQRLYFSSQRGKEARAGDGYTFEILKVNT